MKVSSMHLNSLLLGIFLLTLIFVFEIYTKSLAGTTAYILVLLFILWLSRTSRHLFVLGVFSSLAIVTSFLYSFPKVKDDYIGIGDRALSLAVVWLAVYFTYRFRKLYDQQRSKVKQLDALFQNANEGILFTNINGDILLANPFLERLFGYKPGELVNKSMNVLMPKKFTNVHQRYREEYAGKPQNRWMGRDVPAVNRNGKEFPVEINLSHYYNDNKLEIIAFVVDATDKKRRQASLKESMDRMKIYSLELEEKVKERTAQLERSNEELKNSQVLYKAMAHNFPDGIIGVLDKDMKYLLVDGKDLHLLGLKEETVIGDRLFDNIHAAMTTRAEGSLKKVYQGESISFDLEIDDNCYNVTSVPIPNSEGVINQILVVVKNISTQKKLERDLISTVEKEKELNVLKSRFVTMASHEFRTPLTTILSSAFLLDNYSGEQLDKEKKKHIARIKRSVQGLTELLNDFLSMGKIEEKKVQVSYSEINPHKFMEDVLQEFDLLKKDDQRFELVMDSLDHSVISDKQLLRSILMNLLSNAVKYSPNCSTIKLNISFPENQMVIRISDQGIGVSPEETRFIFQRFFRGSNASGIQGTGLGLNIVKNYVTLLNGKIEFTSEVNAGTTFTVTLPVRHTELIKNL